MDHYHRVFRGVKIILTPGFAARTQWVTWVTMVSFPLLQRGNFSSHVVRTIHIWSVRKADSPRVRLVFFLFGSAAALPPGERGVWCGDLRSTFGENM